jgi:thiamine-phosphate pyrophosphorylase
LIRAKPDPPVLYGIADRDALGERSLPDAVEAMAQSGITWIQIRAKSRSDDEILPWIEESCDRLAGTNATLWVNDRADLAALFRVQGLHVGQTDCPPWAARKVLGEDPWIGSSTHDLDQVEAAEADPAVDVIAIGPVFATRSKLRPDPLVGLELVRRARQRVRKPLVAIGGIDANNAARVLEAGASCVAVIDAVCRGGSIERNARRLLDAIR